MDEVVDWWKEYLEKKRQKEMMKEQIRSELESMVNEMKAQLNNIYDIKPISRNHREIMGQIEHQFDGKANQALVRRFEKNYVHLLEANLMYTDLYESIRLRGWFW
ncbi:MULTISPECIES: hypothetical protein [Allobacillus]|uniref:Uncharacterized protein n=1 Tax=Allobacillus salarius TaxID=1955272 RepID=A0A556PQ63_9BACI|nr:hypothetical protein [Allobacillus salarius]TSJ66505.1 hypothetical protein FPQ13_04405 [Allobacillus salarius]